MLKNRMRWNIKEYYEEWNITVLIFPFPFFKVLILLSWEKWVFLFSIFLRVVLCLSIRLSKIYSIGIYNTWLGEILLPELDFLKFKSNNIIRMGLDSILECPPIWWVHLKNHFHDWKQNFIIFFKREKSGKTFYFGWGRFLDVKSKPLYWVWYIARRNQYHSDTR